MDYIQGLAEQTEIFLYAFGFGFLLGVLYDVFRTLRLLISDSRGFVFFMDLLYSAVCAFLSFCFALVIDSGRLRLYVAAGIILGWLVYYFSFGAIALKASGAIISLLRRALSAILKPIKKTRDKFCRKIRRFSVFCKKIIRKTEKKTKFSLQKHKSIVYNLVGSIKNRIDDKRKKKNVRFEKKKKKKT